MKAGLLIESKYIKKDDLPVPTTVTIRAVSPQTVNVGTDADPDMKHLMAFEGGQFKPLVLNATNIQLAILATGTDETDEWKGKEIVLWNDPTVSFGGKLTGGVRIRPPEQQATPAQGFDPATGEGSDDIPW